MTEGTDSHMAARPLFLQITDTNGSKHVEERQCWGENGPSRVFEAVSGQYLDEWLKEKNGTRPVLSILTREEYDAIRFGGKKA